MPPSARPRPLQRACGRLLSWHGRARASPLGGWTAVGQPCGRWQLFACVLRQLSGWAVRRLCVSYPNVWPFGEGRQLASCMEVLERAESCGQWQVAGRVHHRRMCRPSHLDEMRKSPVERRKSPVERRKSPVEKRKKFRRDQTEGEGRRRPSSPPHAAPSRHPLTVRAARPAALPLPQAAPTN
eukprot:353808-Chlamydomonas_euryale.AAC.1